jgi:hypothetical protein
VRTDHILSDNSFQNRVLYPKSKCFCHLFIKINMSIIFNIFYCFPFLLDTTFGNDVSIIMCEEGNVPRE